MHNMTFESMAEAGFRQLLPIIPHDAEISSYSKSLTADMLGKIPGRKVSDGWVGLADWVHLRVRRSDLKQWTADGAGIGLRCEEVVALDLDVTDEDIVKALITQAYISLGFAPMRIGNAPKALLLFRLDEPGSWPSKMTLPFIDNGTKHLIEILGARQQFVVKGTHPKTKQPYEWDTDICEAGIDGLPTVSAAELKAFLQEAYDFLYTFCDMGQISTSGVDGPGKELDSLRGDPAIVADLVKAIPNPEMNGYQELTTMAHAIWGACQPEHDQGRAILQEWAERWPSGPDLAEADRIYDSIHESSLGIQWLTQEAAQHGANTALADFAEFEDTAELDTEDPDSFWNRYVYINQLKRFVDLRTGQQMDKEQFRDRIGKLGDNQSAVAFFMERHRPHQFCDRMTYAPGNTAAIVSTIPGHYDFNAWRPGPAHSDQWDDIQGSERGLQMWLELAEHLFANAEERDALLDWMAYLLQHPGQKPNWHPLIGGQKHGTGKDSLLIPLVKGLGSNVVTIRTGDLEDQWTWWAENKQLVVVSEMNSFERRAIMNRLKSYMANPPYTVEINKKGIPQYEVPNLFGMIMFTNNEDAVALEKDDRRFFVIWTDAGPLATRFYQEYHALFTHSDEGPKAVVEFLKARDISQRDFQGRAPATEAKERMRQAALPVVEGYLQDAIDNEAGCFAKDLLSMDEVMDHLRVAQGSVKIGPQKVAVYLRSVGAVRLGRVRLSAGNRVNLWAVRRTPTYLAMDLSEAKTAYERQATAEVAAEFGGDEKASGP